MAKRLYMALLFSVVLDGSAAAQTSGIAGAGLTNPYGAVTLPGTILPSNAAAGSGNPQVGVATNLGSGFGAASARSSTSAAPSSGPSGSGGPPTPGAAASSNSIPAWLTCEPPGAQGMAPFLTG